MSSILKALKKLEDEQVSRRGETKDIARNILKERKGQTQFPWLPVIAVIAVVAALAVLGTYAAMGGFGREGNPEVRSLPQTPALPQSAAASPPPSSEEPKTAKELAPIPTVNVKAQSLPVVQQAKAAVKQQPAAPPETATSEALRQPPQESKLEAETPPTPSLRVSGIAWQKESTSRIAIVNGQTVSEGTSVGGARVQTILPDRVEFAYAGQKVIVQLEK